MTSVELSASSGQGNLERSSSDDTVTESFIRSLFPLKLTPFEKYAMLDARDGYSMTSVVQWDFNGRVDREAMDAALAEAILHNPMLRALVRRERDGYYWHLTDEHIPRIQWGDFGETIELDTTEPLDLTSQPGVRFFGRADDEHFSLTVFLHHAQCDGLSITQVCGDIFAAYGNQVEEGAKYKICSRKDIEKLPEREKLDIRLPAPLTRWQIISSFIKETWRMFLRRPALIATQPGRKMPAEKPAPDIFNNIELKLFTPEQTQQMKNFAKDKGVSLNDLLLRDMFITLRDWNVSKGHDRRKAWYKINMPAILRNRNTMQISACNVLGYALLTHRAAEWDDPDAFLQAISAEAQAVRDWSMAAMFLEGLRIGFKIPFAFRIGSSRLFPYASFVISNVGELTRHFRDRTLRKQAKVHVGDMTLEHAWGTPPIRPGTRGSMVVTIMNDSLYLGLLMDPKYFVQEDTHEFLQLYSDRLMQSVAGCRQAESE